jgi:GNAT superfamily N-acetyltransferase
MDNAGTVSSMFNDNLPLLKSCHGMSPSPDIRIKPFHKDDQDAARSLILKGLGERWGWINETINPDLDDIATTFAEGLFLTAWHGETLVGTGGVIPEDHHSFRVVRMSVERSYRRNGIATKILDELVSFAKTKRIPQLVLETTSTWKDAIAFYQQYGFQVTHVTEDDTYFILHVESYAL